MIKIIHILCKSCCFPDSARQIDKQKENQMMLTSVRVSILLSFVTEKVRMRRQTAGPDWDNVLNIFLTKGLT